MSIWLITCKTVDHESVLCVVDKLHNAQSWLLENIDKRIKFRDLRDENLNYGTVKIGFCYESITREFWAVRVPFIGSITE